MSHSTFGKPREFRVDVPEEAVQQILRRVDEFQFPPCPDDEEDTWTYGVNSKWMRDLCSYWTSEYDWRAVESELNSYPQYRVDIGGMDLHFVKVEGEREGTRPLLLLHGWPGSHYEYWKLIDLLAFPTKYGGSSKDAFDLIIPSLPGYGFSGVPKRPIGPRTTARLLNNLMVDVLQFPHYMVQGGGGCPGSRGTSVTVPWLFRPRLDRIRLV